MAMTFFGGGISCLSGLDHRNAPGPNAPS
jgi:hypothetical protein